MKKMLMLVSLLVMVLGVSPSFAAKKSKKSNQSKQYYPMMVCVDAANVPFLSISFAIADIGKVTSGKSKRKVTALVRALSDKTGQIPVLQVVGDLGVNSEDRMTFSSTFSVFFAPPVDGMKVLTLSASTGDPRKKMQALTSSLDGLGTKIQLTCATPR